MFATAKCLGHGVSWLPPLRHSTSFPGGFFLLPDDLKTIFSSCFTFPQVTLLFKHWNEFGDVIIEYGTMKSPQCKRVFLCLSKRILIYERIYIYVYMYTYKYEYVYSSDSIVMVSCIFSSLVVSKSARECHFLCQVIKKYHRRWR